MRNLYGILCFLFFITGLSAQKMMKIPFELKDSSTEYQLKSSRLVGKGLLMKYAFGPYRVEDTRSGVDFTSGKTKGLFRTVQTEELHSRMTSSFKLIKGDLDTLTVALDFKRSSTAVRRKSFYFGSEGVGYGPENTPSQLSKDLHLFGEIRSDRESSEWELYYSDQMRLTDTSIAVSGGLLAYGTKNIEITQATHWADGSMPVLYNSVGFYFKREGRMIAALQTPVDTFQKKFIWLANDLEAPLKDAIVAASLALVSYNHYKLTGGD